MLANLLTLNVLQQKTIGLTDSDGLQNPALGKAAFRQAVKNPSFLSKNQVSSFHTFVLSHAKF
jgi:hypothetical protein